MKRLMATGVVALAIVLAASLYQADAAPIGGGGGGDSGSNNCWSYLYTRWNCYCRPGQASGYKTCSHGVDPNDGETFCLLAFDCPDSSGGLGFGFGFM